VLLWNKLGFRILPCFIGNWSDRPAPQTVIHSIVTQTVSFVVAEAEPEEPKVDIVAGF
jgi:hypothetical protein